MLPLKAYLARGNTMLDLIELTNREVIYMMVLSFTVGILATVVLVWVPTKTKLDTLIRKNAIREYLS